MTTSDAADDGLVYSPTPLMPEIFLDLDLMLIAATDEEGVRSALIAGTREVLSRFEHLAEAQVFCASSRTVIAEMTAVVRRLDLLGANAIARWLQVGVLDVLTAHQQLHEDCIDQLGRAQGPMSVAISDVAASLNAAAQHMTTRRFARFPVPPDGGYEFNVQLAVLAAMSAELRRNPLRNQLDGAGGAAGSAEYNPYVRAMFALELVTHRRLYRILYSLAEHVGVDLRDDDLFQQPEVLESQAF